MSSALDRDQSKTEETVALTELFLREEHFSTYREDVLRVQKQCYEQLAASECNVCSFYLSNGKLKAAEKRLASLRSNWLPKLPTLEPEIIALETQLVEQREMSIALQNKNNNKLAHNTKTKHMAERF